MPTTTVEPRSRDRRVRRSPHASAALNLQLTQVAEQFGLASLVLTDRRGNLWAASKLDAARAHLAWTVANMGALAWRPTADAGSPVTPSTPPGFSIASGAGQSTRVRVLQVGCAELYLAAQGQHHRARAALEQASQGVERILGKLVS